MNDKKYTGKMQVKIKDEESYHKSDVVKEVDTDDV